MSWIRAEVGGYELDEFPLYFLQLEVFEGRDTASEDREMWVGIFGGPGVRYTDVFFDRGAAEATAEKFQGVLEDAAIVRVLTMDEVLALGGHEELGKAFALTRHSLLDRLIELRVVPDPPDD